jgi:hypothetical protein
MALVLVASLPLPIQAHDIYTPLIDSSGRKCCSNRDCRPALYRFTLRGVQMLVDRRWIDVLNHLIQYRALPDDPGETGGGHWCGFAHRTTQWDIYPDYVTRCAILPPQSGTTSYDSGQFTP